MEIFFFLKGILIGFIMAIPLGPIGIMCIRKTLTEGRMRGLVVGFGAASADLLYGTVAAFGLTVISNTLFNQRIWIRLVGGAVILFLGVRTFVKQPDDPNLPVSRSGILRSYLTTLLLTLTNPFTIFAFLAVFTTLGLGKGLGYLSATTLVTGIFFGSFLWFLLLNSGVILFRKKLDLTGLKWVNRITGVLIMISGVITIASLL